MKRVTRIINQHKGWREIGGKRYYYKSKWEANYARYLQLLKDTGGIKDWDYESETYDFPVKRGINNYTPDFIVIENSGKTTVHEVKGYMDKGSRTKINRFKKYYPEIAFILADAAWFKRNNKKLNFIEGWE